MAPCRQTGAGAGEGGRRVAAGDVGIDAPVQVAHDAQLAFEQNVACPLRWRVRVMGTVSTMRCGQLVPVVHQQRVEFLAVDRLAAQDFDLAVDRAQGIVQPRFQPVRLQQIAHAQAGAGGLVGIGRADAPLGGADGVLARAPASSSSSSVRW